MTKATKKPIGARMRLQEMIGKLLLDSKLREVFDEDPKKAVAIAGIKLADVELEALLRINKRLGEYAKSPELEKIKTDLASHVDEIYVGLG
jgi:hypothetical protein